MKRGAILGIRCRAKFRPPGDLPSFISSERQAINPGERTSREISSARKRFFVYSKREASRIEHFGVEHAGLWRKS